ncbi:hypothetical protein FACS1894187_17310 [Synergistales bacterium]|nr:hypothetical protein FACS1894187_17310 [Synergistales bacterium]
MKKIIAFCILVIVPLLIVWFLYDTFIEIDFADVRKNIAKDIVASVIVSGVVFPLLFYALKEVKGKRDERLFEEKKPVKTKRERTSKHVSRFAQVCFVILAITGGLLYLNHSSTDKKLTDLERTRRAAEQGNAAAQNRLGSMYANGRGVPKDDKQAVEWYRKAADQGHAAAQYNLGLMYAKTKDDKQAADWYRKAAEQGYAAAQNRLGFMYDNGQGVTQDDKQAVEWYRKAADQGYAAAQYNLGAKTKDDKQAVDWYRKAAEQGYASAQYNLGVRYGNGRGVAKDIEESYMWYYLSRLNGDTDARKELDRIEGAGLLSQEKIRRARTEAERKRAQQK